MQAPMNVEAEHMWKVGDTALEHLKAVLRDCQSAGRFKGYDIEFLSFYVWSSMHGMCAQGRMRPDGLGCGGSGWRRRGLLQAARLS